MRKTFAVGRLDRGTSQVVIMGPVRERRAREPRPSGLLSGPWSLRALVRAAATRALRVVR